MKNIFEKQTRKFILLITVLAAAILSGCASGPDYRAAEGSRYGYQEVRLSEDHYRIQYKLRGNKPEQAMDFALLRAAELTLLNGYDWFLATNNEMLVNEGRDAVRTEVSRQYNRSTSCGLLSCRTSYYPTTVATQTFSTGAPASTQVFLTISFGKGVRPENGDTYNAEALKRNIRDRNQL